MKIANRTFSLWRFIWLGFCDAYYTSDAYVSIVDRQPLPSSELASTHVKFFKTDITKVEEIKEAVEGTVAWTEETGAEFGGVVNCAGVGVAGKASDLSQSMLFN